LLIIKSANSLFTLEGAFTRLRIYSHRLRLETGRYVGLERDNRICEKCHMNVVENEIHFVIECPFYKEKKNQTPK
jgi:hypothetical protein